MAKRNSLKVNPQNKAYWRKRLDAQRANEEKKAASYGQRVQDAYSNAAANVQKELEAWYGRFANDNGVSMAEARKLLQGKELKAFRMDVNEYIAKGRAVGALPEGPQKEAWIKELEQASARVHVSRLEAMQLRMRQQVEMAAGRTETELSNMAADVYQDSYYHTAYEIQKGTGVGYQFAQLDENKISKVLSSPWAVDGKDFSDRVWANKQQLINELDNTFALGIIQGKGLDSMSKALADRMNVAQSKAARLVATEGAYFASAGQKDSYKALGVESYEVVATLDAHTSAVCQGLDGKVIAVKDLKPGATAPPFHPNCRCTTVPYFNDEFTEDEQRAARDESDRGYETVPSDMTYPEWKEQFVTEGNIDFSIEMQNYKPVVLSANTEDIERGKVAIRTRKIVDSDYDINVSENVKLKPRQAAFIQSNIRYAINNIQIYGNAVLPQFYVISNQEMQTKAVASYNPLTNKLFISEGAINKQSLIKLQGELACPGNPKSTYYHEMLHWKDAQDYIYRNGPISDLSNYYEELRKKHYNILASVIERGYNINDVSPYAAECMQKGKYDEVYTEYRVKLHLQR